MSATHILESVAVFDGQDDFVEIAHSNEFLLANGTLTLWFQASDLDGKQTLFSAPAGFSWAACFMAPTFRTATARRRCWPRSVRPSTGCSKSSPMAAMSARSLRKR